MLSGVIMKKLKNKTRVITFLVLLILVSTYPELFKDYFIFPGGNIKAIGFTLGVLLSILIYLNWRYAKVFFYVVFVSMIAADLVVLTMISGDHFVSYLLLTLCHLGLLIIFAFSRSINFYLDSEK